MQEEYHPGSFKVRLDFSATTACIGKFLNLALFRQGSTSSIGCGRGEILPGNCDIAKQKPLNATSGGLRDI